MQIYAFADGTNRAIMNKNFLQLFWISVLCLLCRTPRPASGDCVPPPALTDGSYSPVQASYVAAETVTYACDTGYDITGGTINTCDASDVWIGTVPTCTIVTCTPDAVPNSSLDPNQPSFIYNSDVTYSCATGYELASGHLTRTCQANATWTGDTPVCNIVTCSPDAVPNSSIDPNQPSFNYNTDVTYSCATGYELASGHLTRTCQANATWTGDTPVCNIVTCTLDAVPNSSTDPSQPSFIYNTDVTYSCATGYELASGHLTRTCQANATWTGDTPVCNMVTCTPDAVPNSSIDPNQPSFIYNSDVTYSCATGYELASGHLTRTCQANATWTGDTPVCNIVTCTPDAVPNSSIDPNQPSFNYNTDVTYSCATGYELASGHLTRTCQANATWTGDTPVCNIVTCTPDAVPNSSIDPNQPSFNYNTDVTYSCATGYELASGHLTRTCQANATWTGDTPVCNMVTCTPDAVPNSSIDPNQPSFNYNSDVTYSCATGYELASGHLTRTCQANATWTGDTPVCNIVTCTPDAVPNSSIDPNQPSFNYNTDVTYSCATGYELASGHLTRTCQANATWTGDTPVCNIVTCTPDAVPNSSIDPNQPSFNYNTDVTYSCATGYALASGHLTRTCQANATWTGDTPVCNIKQCPADAVANSNRVPSASFYDYNTLVHYDCAVGYNQTNGNEDRTCKADTSWTGISIVCTIVTCDPPETVSGATTTPSGPYVYNDVITYECATGYEIDAGSYSRQCEATQTWSGTAPTICIIKKCTTPAAVANADVTPVAAEHDYAVTITYTCVTGYKYLSGSMARTCQDSKAFDGSAPSCTIKQCAAEAVADGWPDPDIALHDYGTSVTYECNMGWAHTAGNLYRTCDNSELWTGDLPTCTVSSCLPDPTTDGSISPVNATYTFGVDVTYACDPGYYHSAGHLTRTCLTSGLFDRTLPTCSRVTCAPPGDITDGAYLPYLVVNHDYGTIVTYTCNLAFNCTSGDLVRTCQQDFSWSGTEPVCSPYACIQEDSTYMDTVPDQQLHEFDSEIVYTCITGYNYSTGDVARTCQTDGQWNGTAPDCVIVTCPIPPAPAHASIDVGTPETDYNTYITYTCELGYNRTGGDETRRCTETSDFDNTEAVCTIVECDPPGANAYTSFSPELPLYNYSMTTTYSCDLGYYWVSGDNTSSCNEFGGWTGTPITCSIVQCAKPIDAHADNDPNQASHDFNTTVASACVIGYNLTGGDDLRTCQATGTWDGTPPSCTIVECEFPGAVDLSSYAPLQGVYVYLDVLTYTCDVGYEVTSGNASRQCTETSFWTGAQPNCTIKHCAPPAMGTEATYSPVQVDHEWNTTVAYTCNFAYNHSTGALERTCMDDKTWSEDAPVCLIVTCDKIDVAHMTFDPPTADTHDFNTTIEYACDIGYNHSYGDLVRTCDHTSVWTGDLPNCTIVECEFPGAVDLSSYAPVVPLQGVYVYLDILTYTCDVGYEVTSGSASRQCTETSFWTGAQPNCTIKYCTPPAPGTQTTYTPVLSEHEWNTTVDYTCNLGYNHSTGALERTCMDDKTWSGDAPVCLIVTCDKIDVAHMTFTPPTADTHDFNTTISYACDIGYNHSNGDLMRTCNYTSVWTGDLPNCTIVECEFPGAVDMSSYAPLQGVYVYLDVLTYTCDVGYEVTSGNVSRQCTETSFWTGAQPNCTIKYCIPPAPGTQTTYLPVLSEHEWNTTVEYTCNLGYNHSTGDLQRTCMDDKTWSGDAPVCLIVTCDKIDVAHMTFDPPTADTHDFNTTIEYACDIGYNQSYGDLMRTCNYTGVWTGDLPNCTIVECDFPDAVIQSTHDPVKSPYVYLDVLTYTCVTGYERTSGDPSRTCRETSFWDNTAPNCTIKHCVPPAAGTDATYNPVEVEHDWNTTVDYACNLGYNHSTGDLQRTCMDDKSWSGAAPVCLIVTCDKIDIQFMTFTPPTADTHDYNTTIEYSCIVGYNHSFGDLFRTCHHTGVWTGDQPNCTIITCDPPAPIAFTSYVPVQIEHDWNTDINYTCDDAYHYVSGIDVTTCNESGVFPPVDFDCSVQHTLAAQAGEPAVKWMNSTMNETSIVYDFDGLCDVVLTLDPTALIAASYTISGTTITVDLAETPTTAFGVYTVNLAPFRLSRTWADYNSTVFYGEEVLGLTALLDNPILYLAVGTSYNFETSATQGTTVTLQSTMGDATVYSVTYQDYFVDTTVPHTYNTPGDYDATFVLSNLVSSETAVVSVTAIYAINNVLFRVATSLVNVTTAADFEFRATAVANMPMHNVNVTIDYNYGTGDTDSLDLGDTASVPVSFPYSHLFGVQGQYIVNADAVSWVSSQSYSLTMDVWDSLLPLDFVIFNGTGKYITNTTAQFQFVNPPDAGFEYIIDYGDGTVVQSAGDGSIYLLPYSLSVFDHVYNSPAVYTVRWRAWNGWSAYDRDERFTVLVQNRIPRDGFILLPVGRKYPWINLQSMNVPVNITLNDTVALPTNATCIFEPLDGKPQVSNIKYETAFVNHPHSFTDEGMFNSTLDCSNEVSQFTYEFNLLVEKYLSTSLSVHFQQLVPMNYSSSALVDFFVESGGYALIPHQVFLAWDYGDGGARRRRAVGPTVPYDTSVFSHTYTVRDNYTIEVFVQADVTSTSNTLTYSLRVGIMYFEYSHTVAFLNYTTVRYTMYGVQGNTLYTLSYDGKTVDYTCSSTDYNGCYIDHMCPSYGYMLVVAVASNGSFVEYDQVNVTCDNPIPDDMEFSIPTTVAIPDGYINYQFKIKSTDLFLPLLTCKMNFGDPVKRRAITDSQEVTFTDPFDGMFQYIAIGRHSITIDCWNLINSTTYTQGIIVTNKDFLFSGVFDRQYSQSDGPLLISAIRDTAIFSRLVILANHTIKTHYNLWTTNATMNPAVWDRHDLLFTRGEAVEDLYYVELKVSFIQQPNNSIFEPTWVRIVMVPPHAEIVGGRRRLAPRDDIIVDALTFSYDPARPASPMSLSFAWACLSYDATSFEDAISKHTSGTGATACTTSPTSSGVLTLHAGTAPLKSHYVVTVTVNNSRGMTADFAQYIDIDNSGELSILCKINCLAKVAVTSSMQLVPNLDHNCPGSFNWELTNKTSYGDPYGAAIDLAAITTTGYVNRSLTIVADSLEPAQWYLVTLTALIDGASKKAHYEFLTNRPPEGGTCEVILFEDGVPLNASLPMSPADYATLTQYEAGIREYNLTCTGWKDEGYTDNTFTTNEPLFYFFYLSYNSSDEAQRQILYFDPGSTANLVTFQIGDPDLVEQFRATVVLQITDVFGDYAELRYDVVSKPSLTTAQLAPLSMAGRLTKLQDFVSIFEPNMTKANTTWDYRSLSRKIMDVFSVLNYLELNTSSTVTLTPEDLLSLGYKEDSAGDRISWSDYWRLIVEVVDTSTSDYLIQTGEKYATFLHEAITTWPDGKKITIVAIESMSRALTHIMNRTENTNVTAAKLAAHSVNIMTLDLATYAQERPFPNSQMIWGAASAIRSLIRNIVMALQTVLTPNLPEDPSVDEMRNYLEYMQIFKTTEEVQSQPLSLQEQTFLAQKQLQKYFLAKYIKSEASKLALPNITEALRNLTVVFQGLSAPGQQEMVLEDDIIYVSTEIVPAYELQGFEVIRPRVAMDVGVLSENNPALCNSSTLYIRTIIFKTNPYFWGTFADRISSYVPVLEIDGAVMQGDFITFRLGNKVVPECLDATPTYDENDPNKMIYILFDRQFADDDILLFIRPNATDLVYQLYFNKDEKPVIEENKYIYSTEIKTDKWTIEDGYKLMIKSTEFSTTGKIWIALRPLLETSTDLSLLTAPFCANVTSVNCLAWVQDPDTGEFFWDKSICEVSRSSSRAETECVCENPGDGSPMTVGTTFYVPPSKVDFKNLDEGVSEYGRAPVLAMIIATMVAYSLLVFWAWREDAKDQYKWSFSLLIDNDIADSYFYIMKVYTGLRAHSGTRSKVGFVLIGDTGHTGERIMDDESHVGFERGSVRTFVMSTRRKLGELCALRVWHDDTGGESASWYLNKIVITDLQNNIRFLFLCNKWFTYDSGDQHVDRTLVARPFEESNSFKDMVSYTVAENHIWVSLFLRPLRSNFTRIQRLASLMGLVYVTMIVCVMILKTPDEHTMSQVVIGPFRFSLENFETSMIAVTIATVAIIIVTFFFRNAEAPSKPNDIYSWTRIAYRKVNDKIKLDKSVLATTYDPPAQKTVAYDYHFLPHFCKYIGWTILLVVVGIASYLLLAFSDEWKLVKSEEWMTAIFVGFMGSILFLEPLKILIMLMFYGVFCPRAYEPPDPYINISKLLEITKHNSATLTYGPQFEDVLKSVDNPDKDTLIQHKIDRIRDHQLLKIFSQLVFFSGILYMVYTISYQSRDPMSFYLKNHVVQSYNFANEVSDKESYIAWLNGTFINTYFSHSFFGTPNSANDLKSFCQDLANVSDKESYIAWLNGTFINTYFSHTFFGKPNSATDIKSFCQDLANVSDKESYIAWLNGTFINTYFSHSFFGTPNSATDLKSFCQDLANVRVGPARLRQLRVLPEQCQGPLGVNQTCHNKFEDDKSDMGDFCVRWTLQPCDVSQKSTFFTSPAWLYTSAEEVWGFPTIAEYAVYGGGGYFMKLDVNMEVSINIFKELVTLGWLDKQTRAVILEFTIYNGNSNLFCYSKYVAEFPEVGGVVTFLDNQVFRLDSHYGPEGEFMLFLEFIFLLCVVAATLKILQEIATDVVGFFKSVWNILDVISLIMSYTTIGCYIYKLIIAAKTSEVFREDKNAYVGFENIAFYDFVTNTTHAILVFLLSLRVSRILGYSGKINEMAAVIAEAADDLLAFLVIFAITYFAYVAYGTLLFGKEIAKYRDMFHTYGTLTESVVGKNRLQTILLSKPGFAEFYYFTFVLFVLLTLVTMAAAILNFSISEVKEEQSKLAPTNIVEVIFDRISSLFRRMRGLTERKGDKYKVSEGERRTSETELNAILSELRIFLRSINTNGKPMSGSKYRPMSADSTASGTPPPVFDKIR